MIVVIFIVVACCGVSAVAAFSYLTPRAEVLVATVLGMYDDKLPEITIRDGRASIQKPEPYFVKGLMQENLTVVIDTREGKQGEALNYLKDFESGVAITRDAVVSKLRGQIRIVPLKGVPDVILNSRTLLEVANGLLPSFVPWAAALIFGYFAVVKTLQVLLAALVAYTVTRSRRMPATYVQWIKVCSFALIPPVCLDLVQYLTAVRIPGGLFAYFALYAAAVVAAGSLLNLNRRALEISAAGTSS